MLASEVKEGLRPITQSNRTVVGILTACIAFCLFFVPVLLLQPSAFLQILWGVLGVLLAGAVGMLVSVSAAPPNVPVQELSDDLLRLLDAAAARQFDATFPSSVPGCPYCRSRRVRVSEHDPEDIYCPSCRRYYLRSISLECWRAYFKLQSYAGLFGVEQVMSFWKPDPNELSKRKSQTIYPCDAPDILRAILASVAKLRPEYSDAHVQPDSEPKNARRSVLA